MNKSKLSIINKYLIVIIGIISLIFTSGYLDGKTNLKIFTMFTTISNILVVIYFMIDLIYLRKHHANWCPIIKQTITMSILVTFLVAALILRMGFDFKSFFRAAFLGLHFVVPILTILDAIIFDKKGFIKKYYPFIWIIPIYVYFICCLLFKYYPYPFIDVAKLGIGKVLINAVLLTIAFLIIGNIYCYIDKIKKG